MTDRARRVVEIAREWVGTPYRHQASAKGAGTDCLGLLRGVWREIYGAEPEPVPAYTADWSEPDGAERLWQAARRQPCPCGPQGPLRAGEGLLFPMRAGPLPKHRGIARRRRG